MSFECIDQCEAKILIQDKKAQVIDIRDKHSFHIGHIKDAIHITEQNVDEFLTNADFANPLIVCCYHGNMSKSAAAYFYQKGFQHTYSLDGGYEDWSDK